MASKPVSKVFFIRDCNPTEKERAEAEALGITAFRNTTFIVQGESLEAISAGAGAVPEAYKALPGFKVLQAPTPAPVTKGDSSKTK